jgi:hypothetical protein
MLKTCQKLSFALEEFWGMQEKQMKLRLQQPFF